MSNDETIKILARHLMQCGALMPMEWVQKNGEGSEFMQAYEKAMNAIKNEPIRCKDCKHRYTLSSGKSFCKEHFPMGAKDDDFCSYGERREGE